MRRNCLASFALAAAALFMSASVHASTPCPPDPFLQATTIAVGGPASVAVGEFTGDSFPDVLASVSGVGMVLLAGNGDGTFAPLTVVVVAAGDSLVASDFDGNGTTDFAIGGSGWIDVYLGNGDGTFGPPTEYQATGGGIEHLVAADLNGDGKPDLATVGGFDVVVLLNQGNGTFSPAVHYNVVHTLTTAFDLAVGDLDGDGAVDIVSAGNALYVLHNLGDGSFEEAPSIPVSFQPTGVAVGDVDGDGHADIGYTHRDPGADGSPGYVGVFLNNGDGTFQAAVDTVIEGRPGPLALTDLDGDGRVDGVALANGLVEVLRGTGSASFASVTGFYSGNALPAFGDLDGDGLLDVVTSVFGGTVNILFGNGAARLRAVEQIVTPVGAFAVVGADFDGDGVEDAAVRGNDNDETVLLGGNGDGTFRPPVLIDGNSSGTTLVTGDFDRDGKNDLVVGGDVLLGNGDGTFRAAPVVAVLAFGAGDFDGDGLPDLAGRTGSSGDLGIAFGAGDGTFSSPVVTPVSVEATQFEIGEFNGDGKSDLAFVEQSSSFGDGSVHVWLSNGDGTFAESFTHSTGVSTPSLYVADVTGEGKADLLTAEGAQGTLLYFGHGDGTFDEPVVLDPQQSYGAVAADFDGDGIADVVVSNYEPYETRFLKGLGAGTFAAPVLLGNVGQFGGPVGSLARFSGSLPDIVMSRNQAGTSFALWINGHLAPMVADRSVVVGSAAILGVAASGQGALTYQWRKGGVPLVDGGRISGATTARLIIDPVSFDDAGSYDVLVTDACNSVASNTGTLSVEFADVPVSSPFHSDILTIATAGITGGCGGGNYCPASPVRRDQMAAFLLKAEHGSAYVPPACAGLYTDVPCPSPFAAWIEQLAAEGVTTGCGGGNYCPDATVTRAQMAVFLLKTSQGSGYTPPTATGIFGDVPVGSFAADFIEALYSAGITGGCQVSPLLYCPNNGVLRQQMATFLVRTFLTP